MTFSRYFLTSVAYATLVSGAIAAPATQEGAERLTATFQTYLGQTPGVVRVVPAGDLYRLTLNFEPLAQMVAVSGATVEISPLNYELTDNGDGTWGVSENQSFALSVTLPGFIDYRLSLGALSSEGTWDESLSYMSTATGEMRDLEISSSVTGPDGAPQNSETAFATGRYQYSGAAAAGGGVNLDASYEFGGYSQAMAIPMSPGAPPMDVAITAETYSGTSTGAGFQLSQLLDLYAWFVAHPSPDLIAGGQDELRGLLTAALPMFDRIDGNFDLTGLQVTTPVGPFSAETMNIVVDANGILPEGRLREGISVTGLSVPQGIVPPWAVELIPTEATVDFDLNGFDLATPAATLIAAFDLTKPAPIDPAMNMTLLGQLLPQGSFNVGLAPVSLSNGLYDVSLEGVVTIDPNAPPNVPPTGKGTITATGLDKVQQVLTQAPPEVSGQVLMPLGMAMGLAQPGADGAMVWEIDATKPGSLVINGMDLLGMGAQ